MSAASNYAGPGSVLLPAPSLRLTMARIDMQKKVSRHGGIESAPRLTVAWPCMHTLLHIWLWVNSAAGNAVTHYKRCI